MVRVFIVVDLVGSIGLLGTVWAAKSVYSGKILKTKVYSGIVSERIYLVVHCILAAKFIKPEEDKGTKNKTSSWRKATEGFIA